MLTQDGITNGAIYALLALALVLVFAVTRVIWIPSGEFVAYGTLTLAGLQLGKPPGTVGLLVGMAIVAGAMETSRAACARRSRRAYRAQLLLWTGCRRLASPRSVRWRAPPDCRLLAQVVLTLAAVTALGPLLYRIAYQPLAEASVLVLLIVSRRRAFRADRARTLVLRRRRARGRRHSSQRRSSSATSASACRACWSSAPSVALIARAVLFFGRTLYGKALRATAVNRVGARLVGISPSFAGALTFTLGGAAVRVLRRADRADHHRSTTTPASS